MIFGSVCSGIEAASVAWRSLGWRAAFVSEIDAFPCALLDYRYPDVPNYGDMTKFKEWPNAAISVLMGGTPCQSFSRAGERRGLDDPRGDLALVFLAMARRYSPRWIVWENVVGALSANGGRDFGTILGAMGECGYGYAWRVLDAQYFGVPQRRRRLFLVGHLGDWRRAAAVLFEPESMRGHSPALDRERSKVAATLAGSRPGAFWNGDHVTQTLDAVLYKMQTLPEKNRFPAVVDEGRLRFITPLEAERLQGFPDHYTDVPFRGKRASAAHRYKAIGNSMPVPIIRWIGERIAAVDQLQELSLCAN